MFLTPHHHRFRTGQVFLEAPAGVGFSYADTAAGLSHNDTGTAADNYQAVAQFLKKFPEFATNDLYIAGESYAGAYVPMLALEILAHNKGERKAVGAPMHMNLKGILVGNGGKAADHSPRTTYVCMCCPFHTDAVTPHVRAHAYAHTRTRTHARTLAFGS